MNRHEDYLQVFRGEDNQWYWRVRNGGNFKIIDEGGEGFTRRWSAKRAAKRAHPGLKFRP